MSPALEVAFLGAPQEELIPTVSLWLVDPSGLLTVLPLTRSLLVWTSSSLEFTAVLSSLCPVSDPGTAWGTWRMVNDGQEVRRDILERPLCLAVHTPCPPFRATLCMPPAKSGTLIEH